VAFHHLSSPPLPCDFKTSSHRSITTLPFTYIINCLFKYGWNTAQLMLSNNQSITIYMSETPCGELGIIIYLIVDNIVIIWQSLYLTTRLSCPSKTYWIYFFLLSPSLWKFWRQIYYLDCYYYYMGSHQKWKKNKMKKSCPFLFCLSKIKSTANLLLY